MAKHNFFIFLFLLFICFCVYFNALNNEFIFDDDFVIVKNLYIKNISSIPRLFKTDIFHFQHPEDPSLGEYYRPLQSLSYVFDYHFWKLNPVGYRLVNIIIQSINGFLLYLLICLIFKDNMLALLSAILFCIHPIQVSDVVFISGRNVLVAMFFILSSIVILMNYFLYQKKIDYFSSIVFFILSLLTWETALLLPLFIIFCAVSSGANKRRLFLSLLPFIFISLIYLILRSRFIPSDKLRITNIFTSNNLKGFFYYLGEYFNQLILPVGSQKLIFRGSIIGKFILSIFSLGLITFVLIKAVIFKHKQVIFGILFYFIGLLPLINLTDKISTFGPVNSEHYAYIACAGFFILISYLLIGLRHYSKKIAKICIIIIIAIYSTLTIINNTNYKDDITFYNHILSLNQKQNFIRVNLGTVYYKKKMYAQAIQQAKLALAQEPFAWDAYLLLGNIFMDKGNLDRAMQLYKKALILYPRGSKALNNMALIYEKQNKDKQAYETFKKALQIDSESLLILKNFVDFLVKKKLYNEAMSTCEEILELNPEDINARLTLGIIFAELGYFKEAELSFLKALRLDANSSDAMKNLGALYANFGNFDRAILIWEKALKIKPDSQELKKNTEQAKELKGY